MEIDFKNVFIASIKMLNDELLRIVVALNDADAKKTLLSYYENPQVMYVISFHNLKSVYEKAKQNPNYYLTLEVKEESQTPLFEIHEDIFVDKEELVKKYIGLRCFTLDSASIIQICSHAAQEFENPEQPPLISENINL